MTLAPLRVQESPQTAALSVTHAPIGKGGKNWITRTAPGNTGELPAYIQNVRNGIMKHGKSESEATQLAIGVVRNWASGKGNVSPEVRAAAAKAVAQFEALRAKSKASKVNESAMRYLERLVRMQSRSRLEMLREQLGAAAVGKLLEADSEAWAPTTHRVASAAGEKERHDVMDGAQTVGSVACRQAYSPQDPDRWSATTINGQNIGRDHPTKAKAIATIRKHLAEAPARVQPFTGGKFLVARPESYGGQTSYQAYPSEAVARFNAGLPANATTPERGSQVHALGEMIRFDLALVEYFHFDPSEMRNFRGEWIGHGNKGKLSQLPEIPLGDLGGSVGPGKWSPGAGHAVNDILEGKIEDTEHAHREMHGDGSLGPYSKGREALHQAILTRLFQGKMSHPQDARAIFTAGGPASGKSQMISKGHVDHPKDVVHVNPDIVKEMLPEYAELKKAGRTDASSLVHEEASHISKLAMAAALQHKHHVLVDTVGGGAPGKFVGKVKAAQAAGHKVSVHYTSISAAEAVKRSEARAKREQARTGKLGRRVPEGYLRTAHAEVSARFPEVQALPGVHKQVFDNNGKEIRLIAEQKAADDKIRIVDGRAYRAFLAKAKGR